MSSAASTSWSTRLGLLVVLCLFCAPLFVGLDRWDLGNDEAIYSYAVDRILETGDWLTPRSIPRDEPFFEKPPLKFWIVAAAIRTGLLPHDEFGLRATDAVFASIAFVYVFMLGRLLAGPLCGVVAVLVLFTLDPLLFEHGLRSNNMEAPLFLAFCGGVYHFARWVEDASRRNASAHALAVAMYFTLGFMTKFVAALFLPVVCAVALAWHPDGLLRLTSRWRDWRLPLLVVLAATLPWFIYQALRSGGALWETMVERHVYERFTANLDLRHLQPWNYYYRQLWLELILAGSHWIGACGAVMLAVKAWTGRPWLWRLLFVWLMLPLALMSFGTSKLFHYTYPFLPALALGGGAVADALFRAVLRYLSVYLGTANLRAAASRIVATGVVVVILPVLAYPRILERANSVRQPLRSLRGCVMSLGPRPTHVFLPYDDLLNHAYYYYLRGTGRWVEHPRPRTDDLVGRIAEEPQPLLLVSRNQYSDLTRGTGPLPGITLGDREPVVIVTSGLLAACTPAAAASGGLRVGPQYRVIG